MQHLIEQGIYWRISPNQAQVGNIVYIHGLGESGLCFESLMKRPELKDWKHFALDLAGYGKSVWRDKPLSLDLHAEKIAQWLASRNFSKTILFGHSMGAVIGLILCEKYPELVSAFVNVEGNISVDDCHISKSASVYSQQDFIQIGYRLMKEQYYRSGFEDDILKQYYISLALCDPKAFHLNSQELVDISIREEIAFRLARLKIPQVFILGQPDGLCLASMELISQAGLSYVTIESSGHWPFLQQQDIFVNKLKMCLKSLVIC